MPTQAIDAAIAVRDERTVKLSTNALNNMLRRATAVRAPPRACRLTFITQAKVSTPTFTVFATNAEKLHPR
jgi:predicted GTPase